MKNKTLREYKDKKHTPNIRPILMRNFDNGKYMWTKADTELNELIESKLIQREAEVREEILEGVQENRKGTFEEIIENKIPPVHLRKEDLKQAFRHFARDLLDEVEVEDLSQDIDFEDSPFNEIGKRQFWEDGYIYANAQWRKKKEEVLG